MGYVNRFVRGSQPLLRLRFSSSVTAAGEITEIVAKRHLRQLGGTPISSLYGRRFSSSRGILPPAQQKTNGLPTRPALHCSPRTAHGSNRIAKLLPYRNPRTAAYRTKRIRIERHNRQRRLRPNYHSPAGSGTCRSRELRRGTDRRLRDETMIQIVSEAHG